MSAFSKEENIKIDQAFKKMLENNQQIQAQEDIALVTNAFEFAKKAHDGIRRKNKEPYMVHPIEVARIATVEIGLGVSSAIAAMLHDVVEDTDYTANDIENFFGPTIRKIVEGLTKLDHEFSSQITKHAENFKHFFNSFSEDVRIVLIKLADRLHNMRTLEHMLPEKQLRIASETFAFYVPLAKNLGLYDVKIELENLSFRYKLPKSFARVEQMFNEKKSEAIHQFGKFIKPISQKLNNDSVNYQLEFIEKTRYSAWKILQTQNDSYDEIFNFYTVCFIIETKENEDEKQACFNVYNTITGIYKPKPSSFDDYMAMPKINGYESLHITVMSSGGRWVPIIIRTSRMHKLAKYGLVSAWKSEEEDGKEKINHIINRLSTFVNDEHIQSFNFIDSINTNFKAKEIIIFTPAGEARGIIEGATALDFAYDIHSDLGNTAIAVKINSELKPLSQVLNNGDQVEVISSENADPKFESLDFVVTPKAISILKKVFRKKRESQILSGQDITEQILNELKQVNHEASIEKLIDQLNLEDIDELYIKVSKTEIDLEKIKDILTSRRRVKLTRFWMVDFPLPGRRNRKKTTEKSSNQNLDLSVKEGVSEDSEFVLANCCKPMPGDEIIGHVANDGKVYVHRADCESGLDLTAILGDKIIHPEWKEQKLSSQLVRLVMKGIDRIGIVSDITRIISEEMTINMRTINVDALDGLFEASIDMYAQNTDIIDPLVKKLKSIENLMSIERINFD